MLKQLPCDFKQLLFCEIGEPGQWGIALIGPVPGTIDSLLELYFYLRLNWKLRYGWSAQRFTLVLILLAGWHRSAFVQHTKIELL